MKALLPDNFNDLGDHGVHLWAFHMSDLVEDDVLIGGEKAIGTAVATKGLSLMLYHALVLTGACQRFTFRSDYYGGIQPLLQAAIVAGDNTPLAF